MERPIIFSAAMIPALLDDTKTQTRRVVKPQAPIGVWDHPPVWVDSEGRWCSGECHSDLHCPYGCVGDRLWVRETWRTELDANAVYSGATIRYAADNHLHYVEFGEYEAWDAIHAKGYNGWRSPIFMPRWASRITLELTDVRVHRVQDISEADARAEGVAAWDDAILFESARDAFAGLWEKINGKRGHGWSMNEWVWALTFKRVGA